MFVPWGPVKVFHSKSVLLALQTWELVLYEEAVLSLEDNKHILRVSTASVSLVSALLESRIEFMVLIICQ